MATLADKFLEDLEDLEDEVEETVVDIVDDDVEEIPDAVLMYETAETEGVPVIVSSLMKEPAFQIHMQRVRELKDIPPVQAMIAAETQGMVLFSQEDEEYKLINECNDKVMAVDQEIYTIFRFVRDIYSKKFPELESVVMSPIEYIQVVKRIKNETDLNQIDFSDLLNNTSIMALTVTASTTTGSPLPPGELQKVLGAAEESIELNESKHQMLLYLESRISLLAPNLSAVIGSALTSRLITKAGGLSNLAHMPAQNIQLIGSSKKANLGMSAAGKAMGILYQSDIMLQTPPSFRRRALRLLSGKCSLAARVDCAQECPDGSIGQAYREKLVRALEKEQEPPPAPTKKSLPRPDEKPKARRGGKRYRKMKEKYGLSELRKHANRMTFGTDATEEYRDGGVDFGMIGKSTGVGKLRLQHKQNRVTPIPKRRTGGTRTATSSTEGFTSCLAFTPVQGIELANPDAGKEASRPRDAFSKYFSESAQLLKISNI
eukprot:GHVL01010117.1.p2 GENE.GHVL01010117.1~~GHVL01010117.1.p2  ORF type:complete len:489 (-),score=86.33 GHVL01010117.1:1862-3328(-)